ncbi:hypothetical protein VEGS18_A45710 (plasmid) [Escherichia coli]|nr:hypothetical protein VEGS18_A45710 [Escherichia coli]BDT21100.1 hypothetical protein EC204B2_44410 [Escherichia coli]BEC25674.1 hypothetical protein VEE50_44750 [Escherichia coli]BEC44493.1 hypothetical protein VEE52_48160 [Escherichia coli]
MIAETDGEFIVKRLLLSLRLALQPITPAFPTLYPDPDHLQIFRIVTAFVHKTRDGE